MCLLVCSTSADCSDEQFCGTAGVCEGTNVANFFIINRINNSNSSKFYTKILWSYVICYSGFSIQSF